MQYNAMPKSKSKAVRSNLDLANWINPIAQIQLVGSVRIKKSISPKPNPFGALTYIRISNISRWWHYNPL